MPPKPIDVTIRGKNDMKPGVDSVEKTLQGFADRAKGVLAAPFTALNGVIAGVTVGAIATFAKATLDSAAQADAAWGRVETSVGNAGITFGRVRGSLDALFTSIQKTTRYSDDDATSAFSTLLTISNDYAGSVKNLSLAADIAAKKQIGIGDAAELVGKVMVGETGMLKKYGIVLNENGDAMTQLREKFNGFAERDGETLQGRLAQIANGWDNVKESIGRAFESMGKGAGDVNALTSALNGLGQWVDNHNGLFEKVGKGASAVGSAAVQAVKDYFTSNGSSAFGLGRSFALGGREDADGNPAKVAPVQFTQYGQELNPEVWANRQRAIAAAKDAADKKQVEADKKSIENLKKEYDLLEKTAKLTGLKADDYEKMAAIEQELTRAMRTSAGAGNRADAADFVAQLRDRRDAQMKTMDDAASKLNLGGLSLGALDAKGVHTIGDTRIVGGATAAALPPIVGGGGGGGIRQGIGSTLQDMLGGPDAFKNVDTSLGNLQDHITDFGANTLTSFFGEWQQGIADVIQGHEKLGVVLPRVMRKAVGAALAADAQDTMLRALKASALALTDPSGIHLGQAARLFAIGTAELGVAAALSGGGGGSGSGVSSSGFASTASDTSGAQGKSTVILEGNGLNFNNPNDLDALVAAMRELGNTGDIEVIVRGGRT